MGILGTRGRDSVEEYFGAFGFTMHWPRRSHPPTTNELVSIVSTASWRVASGGPRRLRLQRSALHCLEFRREVVEGLVMNA